MIGAGGGIDDGVELARGHTGHLQGPHGRALGHVGSGLAFGHPVALFDPGAGANPLVGGLHELRQLIVGDDTVGNGEPGSKYSRALHHIIR